MRCSAYLTYLKLCIVLVSVLTAGYSFDQFMAKMRSIINPQKRVPFVHKYLVVSERCFSSSLSLCLAWHDSWFESLESLDKLHVVLEMVMNTFEESSANRDDINVHGRSTRISELRAPMLKA